MQVPQPKVATEQVFSIVDGKKVAQTQQKIGATTAIVQAAVDSSFDSTVVQLVYKGYLGTSVTASSGQLEAAAGEHATHEFTGLNPSTEYVMRTCARVSKSSAELFSEVSIHQHSC